MKIRQGFVSNSSSSSFLLVGQHINVNTLTKKDIEKNEYGVVGDDLADGTDFFLIDNNMEFLRFLKTMTNFDKIHEHFDKFKVYKIIKLYDDEDGEDDLEIDVSLLPKEGKIVFEHLDVDFGSSTEYWMLYNRYVEPKPKLKQEYDKIFLKYQRKEKLKNIK